MSFLHSKIVCAIGRASRSPKMIDRLLGAGMDVARLNFSHGTHEEHAKNISMLRAAAVEHEKPIAILADLQGPKIRTGPPPDRKSTRLNSSHQIISYAVFCLKKKKKIK